MLPALSSVSGLEMDGVDALLVDLGEELVVAEEGVLLVSDLDGGSAILRHVSRGPLRVRVRVPFLSSPDSTTHTCGINTRSPGCTFGLTVLPSLSRPPGPTASTRASFSSLTELSGRKMPPAVLDSALMRCTSTRSSSGASDLMDLRAVDWARGRVSCRGYCIARWEGGGRRAMGRGAREAVDGSEGARHPASQSCHRPQCSKEEIIHTISAD